MPELFLMMMIVAFGLFTLISFCKLDGYHLSEFLICFAIFFVLSIWMGSAVHKYNTTKYDEVIVDFHEMEGSQFIMVDGKPININKTAGVTLRDGDKVKAKTLPHWYNGVLFQLFAEDTYEVIRKERGEAPCLNPTSQ